MSKPDFSLKGKVALITGARRGIGADIALSFAEAGAALAVCDMVVEGGELAVLAQKIRKMGRLCLDMQADISRENDVTSMVKSVKDEFGHIDVLVNNAGLLIKSTMLDFDMADYDKIFATDLRGCFLCSQAVGRIMVEQKKGSIINLSSIAAIKVSAMPGLGVYSVAKAGVNLLTKVLAKELGPYNIRVNAIAPASVKTPISVTWNNPEAERKAAASIPLNRVAQTGEIAAIALFLASDASSFISGSILVASGGMQA